VLMQCLLGLLGVAIDLHPAHIKKKGLGKRFTPPVHSCGSYSTGMLSQAKGNLRTTRSARTYDILDDCSALLALPSFWPVELPDVPPELPPPAVPFAPVPFTALHLTQHVVPFQL